MSQRPQQSIWQASQTWAEAKGAYRLLSNKGATTKKIIIFSLIQSKDVGKAKAIRDGHNRRSF